MKLAEYLALRAEAEGMPTTRALQELVSITCTSQTTVWRWYREGRSPAAAERMMQVWAEATAEQRARWFA